MKLKYCPKCAGIDIGKNINGVEQCNRCRFIGEMKEGSMDEINAARKRAKAMESGSPLGINEEKPIVSNKELNERLAKLKEKKIKTEDFEFV